MIIASSTRIGFLGYSYGDVTWMKSFLADLVWPSTQFLAGVVNPTASYSYSPLPWTGLLYGLSWPRLSCFLWYFLSLQESPLALARVRSGRSPHLATNLSPLPPSLTPPVSLWLKNFPPPRAIVQVPHELSHCAPPWWPHWDGQLAKQLSRDWDTFLPSHSGAHLQVWSP